MEMWNEVWLFDFYIVSEFKFYKNVKVIFVIILVIIIIGELIGVIFNIFVDVVIF